MYLIEHVRVDYDYNNYETEETRTPITVVESGELAEEICTRYGLDLECSEVDIHDNAEDFFRDYVRWSNTIHITLSLKDQDVEFEIYSNPNYVGDFYRTNHYQVDTSRRSILSVSVKFNTNEEVESFNEDRLRYFIRHVFASGETDKKKIARGLMMLLIDEINEQFNQELELSENFTLNQLNYF